ncbi:CehA/McbA family metallohydrolase [Jiella sp. M17.18]|uniref:CehA/McbA family metallohydrolase n=1 Tax=Jiella sp. M17.18 TaxID=3234247 RepID=UPI0034E03CE2
MPGRDAFSAPGRFFRGNIHTHSDRSDGALSPDAVCRAYAEAGYDFLCLSDHFLERFGFPVTDTRELRSNRMTTILGAEIHAPQNSHGEIWHLLACGLPDDFAPLEPDEDAVALARRAVEAGAFLGIAHPNWSSLSIEDGRQMAGLAHAVEIWNTGCAIECDRGDSGYFLDMLLNDGHRLAAYAADDAHFRIADGFGGWMMVKAEENEPETLLAAMKAGRFYSSQGPEIAGLAVEGGRLRVACSPVSVVAVVGRGSRAVDVVGSDLTEAEIDLTRLAGDWCRVVVTDAGGRRAWSNPLWL